jgi:hypothetical protein
MTFCDIESLLEHYIEIFGNNKIAHNDITFEKIGFNKLDKVELFGFEHSGTYADNCYS